MILLGDVVGCILYRWRVAWQHYDVLACKTVRHYLIAGSFVQQRPSVHHRLVANVAEPQLESLRVKTAFCKLNRLRLPTVAHYSISSFPSSPSRFGGSRQNDRGGGKGAAVFPEVTPSKCAPENLHPTLTATVKTSRLRQRNINASLIAESTHSLSPYFAVLTALMAHQSVYQPELTRPLVHFPES